MNPPDTDRASAPSGGQAEPLAVDGPRLAVAWVSSLPGEWTPTPSHRLVLLALACDSFDGYVSRPGIDHLAGWCGLGVRGVHYVLRALSEPVPEVRPALLDRVDKHGRPLEPGQNTGRARTGYRFTWAQPCIAIHGYVPEAETLNGDSGLSESLNLGAEIEASPVQNSGPNPERNPERNPAPPCTLPSLPKEQSTTSRSTDGSRAQAIGGDRSELVAGSPLDAVVEAIGPRETPPPRTHAEVMAELERRMAEEAGAER